jgi:hypothetical protein
MNCHVACLNAARTLVEKVSGAAGQPITADEFLSLVGFEGETIDGSLHPTLHGTHALIRQYRDFAEVAAGLPSRRAISVPVVEKSFSLLAQVLERYGEDMVTIVSLLFNASRRYAHHDFNSALILAWTVVERLLNVLWDKLLEEKRTQKGKPEETQINSERRQKLKGRDFTASIISEILSLDGRIPFDMYSKLQSIRKARNDWLHFMRPVESDDAAQAVDSAGELLTLAADLSLPIFMGHQLGYSLHSYPKRADES